MADCLSLTNVGQMKNAEVTFGDLTVLVGPQATGKSILLQLLKLLVDTGLVQSELARHGLNWEKRLDDFLAIYLGEGMQAIWRAGKSTCSWRGKSVNFQNLVQRRHPQKDESMFFIPAQRVLTLSRGWPRPFTDYSPGDPFAVRDFSEKLRVLLETGLTKGESLFPEKRRLKVELRDVLEKAVFSGFGLSVETHGVQKRLILKQPGVKDGLPVMVWSAGQREFVPLLLGLYWLLPSRQATSRDAIKWVVIEELEMGLHPRAIAGVLLLVLELLSRDYKVCLSTHSPHVLDLVWALRLFREHRAGARQVLDLFDVKASQQMSRLAEAALQKTTSVYYFDPRTGQTSDISNLDPASKEPREAGWGGLSEFSGRVADVVAELVESSGRGKTR
jgi:hypothetical protein